jgi:deoxyribonuclease-4
MGSPQTEQDLITRPAGGPASAEAPVCAEAGVAPWWADGRPRIGIHASTAGEASRALDIAYGLGCTALQIFSGSPRMWPRGRQRSVAPEVAEKFRARRAELSLGPVAIHANYLINLASSDAALWERSVAAFRDELVRGAALGAEYLIVHPGSSRGGDMLLAIENVAEGIARAAREAGAGAPRVLIENTAGQGSCVGARLEELRQILDACRARGVAPQPGVCLDTAHLLAAGYEIRTSVGLEAVLEGVEQIVGLENVKVIHVNDSKTPLGSHRDRHEHIGKGHIGLEAFERILNHPRLQCDQRAFLLETPIDRPGDDRRNVRALWDLLGLPVPAVVRSMLRRVRTQGPRRKRRAKPHGRKSRARAKAKRRTR